MPRSNVPRRDGGFSARDYPLQETTRGIIGAAFEVHRVFGYGFLESVYQRALAVELEYREFKVVREVKYELFHRGISIGIYRADLVVASAVVVEVKTGLLPDPVAQPQLLNYLRASRMRLGLVLHFGPSVTINRIVNSWEKKSARREAAARAGIATIGTADADCADCADCAEGRR